MKRKIKQKSSLCKLTRQVIFVLYDLKTDIFSSKMIASILKVHVRRIYDIVHVLEGAKYIEAIIYNNKHCFRLLMQPKLILDNITKKVQPQRILNDDSEPESALSFDSCPPIQTYKKPYQLTPQTINPNQFSQSYDIYDDLNSEIEYSNSVCTYPIQQNQIQQKIGTPGPDFDYLSDDFQQYNINDNPHYTTYYQHPQQLNYQQPSDYIIYSPKSETINQQPPFQSFNNTFLPTLKNSPYNQQSFTHSNTSFYPQQNNNNLDQIISSVLQASSQHPHSDSSPKPIEFNTLDDNQKLQYIKWQKKLFNTPPTPRTLQYD